MLTVSNIILIFVIHYVADFLLQTRMMGENKSKSVKWLSIHVVTYSLATSISWMFLFANPFDLVNLGLGQQLGIATLNILLIFTITFVTHFITDFITSKISGYFYLRSIGQRYNFTTKQIEPLGETKVSEKDRQKWMGLFWHTIGFDQLMHAVTLLLTFYYAFL